MSITQFTMEEVRCFAERQQFEIRPLTFLVGENSTGKTTVLGCFQVLADYLTERKVDFNRPPYSMGNFKDIVRNSKKKEKAFKLGFTFKYGNEDVECTVEFFEKKGSIEPAIKSITMKFTDGEIVFKADDEMKMSRRLASFDEKRNHYRIDLDSNFVISAPLSFYLEPFVQKWDNQPESRTALGNYINKKEKHAGIGWWSIGKGLSTFSISPIRSQLQRTYDPTSEFDAPEARDMSMELMRTKASGKKEWEALKHRLVEFGKRSGLFQNIDVKNLGRSKGKAFQLKAKVRGPNANLMDVGSGVSQILPILVNIVSEPIAHPYDYKLLQQPEVNLHPRAQAELASLLVMASQNGESFIVETHSDYMIDRARIEIRKGNIDAEDVSLIYLEPKGRVVKVHNIRFDKMGNMVGVPPNYRKFFMKETDQLMGFED